MLQRLALSLGTTTLQTSPLPRLALINQANKGSAARSVPRSASAFWTSTSHAAKMFPGTHERAALIFKLA
jgi:hypothetical protein